MDLEFIHQQQLAQAEEDEHRRLLGLGDAGGNQLLQNDARVDDEANRMQVDGYGRPARFDRRGRLIREDRRRRHLAVILYDLYHKPGGLLYEGRVNWRYKLVGFRIHLTRARAVDSIRFGLINRSSGRNFIPATALLLFTPQELLDSAFDPTQVRNLIPGRERLHVIERNRLLLLLNSYHDCVFGESSLATLRQRETAFPRGCEYLFGILCDLRAAEIARLDRESVGQ